MFVVADQSYVQEEHDKGEVIFQFHETLVSSTSHALKSVSKKITTRQTVSCITCLFANGFDVFIDSVCLVTRWRNLSTRRGNVAIGSFSYGL